MPFFNGLLSWIRLMRLYLKQWSDSRGVALTDANNYQELFHCNNQNLWEFHSMTGLDHFICFGQTTSLIYLFA